MSEMNNMNQQPVQPQHPIIEIPQTYYEKLEKEKAEEAALAQANAPQPTNLENQISKSFIPISLLTAIITFASLTGFPESFTSSKVLSDIFIFCRSILPAFRFSCIIKSKETPHVSLNHTQY